MSRSTLLRGASAGALMLVCPAALGQQSLPTIDVGAARASRPNSAAGQLAARGPVTAGPSTQAPATTPTFVFGPTTPAPSDESKQTGYARSYATSATKTNVPILDTPRSVIVIPKEVLQDNQILNTQEAVKFASGVQTAPSVYYDSFLIRGFSNGNLVYRNNLKMFSVAGAEDPAFIERIEIVKGPAAMLYGRIQPGGLVNFITKKPQEEAAYSIQEQFGSWGLSRTTLDLTGPVTQDKSLLYRVIGVYDHADNFVNFKHRDNGAVLAALAWRPTTQFEANVGVEYNNSATTNRGVYGQQIPALTLALGVPLNGRPANLPRNWTQNDPGMYGNLPDVIERVLVSSDWTYRFNDQWKVTNRFLYQHTDENQNYLLSRGFNLATGLMTRRVSWGRFYRDTWSQNLDLNGEVQTGPVKHNLLFGFDYFDYYQVLKGDNPGGAVIPEIPQLNIWAPFYGNVIYSPIQASIYKAAGNVIQKARQKNFGYYVQDNISYNDFIYFLIGGRYDVAFDTASEVFGATQAGAACWPFCDGHFNPSHKGNPTERRISPNGGLLFKLTPEYSIYASYSESFGTSNASAASADGKPFKPQEGQQYEAGAKTSLFGGRLTGSVAAFDLYLSNVLSPDPSRPNTVFRVAAGTVRSRGVEFDLAGQITDNISLIGSYTYDDVIIIKDTTTGTAAILGKRWAGVPRHSGNLWAKYDTAPGQKEGWAFGAGFYANGLRQGNNTNTYQLPAYIRFDTMLGYRTVFQGVPVEAQLNVTNIGDAKYFEATDGGLNAYYGAPRTFIGSLKAKF